ncbi:hypothetical protein COU56_03275 [Candidatus Pacearchaeota archaeon CG10_big_fil_rev_8_21_14_0_10_31_9]|nr:MAG: hypothetical protein COU56_03275 [Candidatus Pacearchaeota archaeon CG10_big_fil_rev_8_21_14_0_10_31_9]PIZ83513.1 MAG: hypothetical protein COX97_01030 [Candidatus Pacearchaeota archaeon CG_4_10_14_0_2_um_filter_05_32_18]
MTSGKINGLYVELENVTKECGGLDNEPSREIVRQIEEEIGLNTRRIHEGIAKVHGPYSDFEKLMEEYERRMMECDVGGAINVINKYRNQVLENGALHYLPVFTSLDKHSFNTSLQLSGYGVHDAYKMTAGFFG